MSKTIQEVLTEIQYRLKNQSETPLLDAQVLMAHFTQQPRTWVMAHPEAIVDTNQCESIYQAVERMENGEPLPYVLGHWEFYGLDFYLTPDVLIPRPETELLVEHGINWLNQHPGSCRAADIGTGSGCIGISLAVNISGLQVLLADISPQALEVARQNTERYQLSGRVKIQQADLLNGIKEGFDLICANLPYIPTQALSQLEVVRREPIQALDGGESGTGLISSLLDQARERLIPGGLLLVEIEENQGNELEIMARRLYPAAKIRLLRDLAGKNRCLELERSELIGHICHSGEWETAKEHGVMTAHSLEQEGFIHCSQPEQLLEVANRYFPGVQDLVVLWIDPRKISPDIRWELSSGEVYPHIYGPIDLPAVIGVTRLLPGHDGCFRDLQGNI